MIPAPRSQKETFKLLGRLYSGESIDSVLNVINWNGVTPTQVYHAILARSPEAVEYAIPSERYDPRIHFIDTLQSGEFQTGVINFFLRQFDEGKRLVFVHIPKCAGSDLIHNLSRYFPNLALRHSMRDWTSFEELIKHLAKTAVDKMSCADILLSGHFSLQFALANYYRYGDDIFTVVRHPRALVLSHVNYALNILRSDHSISRPDTKLWWSQLNRPVLSSTSESHQWETLALDILHNEQITNSNYICRALGAGTAQTALETLALAPTEIVDTSNYNNWMKKRWGLHTDSRINEGIPTLHWNSLSEDSRHYIDSLCFEDQCLYSLLQSVFARNGSLSITGSQLWDARHL